MIQITVFENINLSRKYVENIAKIIEFIRLFFYNRREIINVYIYTKKGFLGAKMKNSVDFETYSALKEKRNKSLSAKSKKKVDEFEDHLEKMLSAKKKNEFKQKPLKAFKNHQKDFQYDYEEDPYEPGYDEYEF